MFAGVGGAYGFGFGCITCGCAAVCHAGVVPGCAVGVKLPCTVGVAPNIEAANGLFGSNKAPLPPLIISSPSYTYQCYNQSFAYTVLLARRWL